MLFHAVLTRRSPSQTSRQMKKPWPGGFFPHPLAMRVFLFMDGGVKPVIQQSPSAPGGPMPRWVIWDWNGTLLDDAWLCVEILNRLLEEWRLDSITVDRYRHIFDFPVIDFYRQLGFDPDIAFFEEISHRFISTYQARLSACHLHPGVENGLSLLRQHGVRASILSAAFQENLNLAVKDYRLDRHLEAWVGIDNIFASGKVERGRRWIEESEIQPSEMLLVGDTVHDFEVAEAMGVPCVLVEHGHHSRERLTGCGVPVLSGMESVINWILGNKASSPVPG